ncbi:MAG: hypothetical protein OXC68_14175 [Aestuariivita sp.]|nr:hypothetical protein [Aestuariivita sp.]
MIDILASSVIKYGCLRALNGLECGLIYAIMPIVGNRQNLVSRMRNSSRDNWSIDDLKARVRRKGIGWRQPEY